MTDKATTSPSTTTVKPIPDGYQSAIPYLAIKDAVNAIEFYKKAFGAVEEMCLAYPDGKIAHAEMTIGDARIMIADEDPAYNVSPQTLSGSTVSINVYVEDVDALVNQAVAAGATLRFPVQDQFYGDRSGLVVDPFGHVWIIATHTEDVPYEEMHQRFLALYSKAQP